jgi:hypothetical protein
LDVASNWLNSEGYTGYSDIFRTVSRGECLVEEFEHVMEKFETRSTRDHISANLQFQGAKTTIN